MNDLFSLIQEEKKIQAEQAPRVHNADMKTELESIINNGLSGAIMGFNPATQGPQISQADTMFLSARWYLISNFRQVLSEMYVENGLIQTLVDVPVDDGLRGGVELKTKQLDEEQIQDLKHEMDKENDLQTCGQALKWTRLFGGGAIMLITDQDPVTPLDLKKIRKIEFRAIDMWELYHDRQNVDSQMTYDYLKEDEFYNYYGHRVHKSRVLIIKGRTPPSFLRPRLRGWGFSVLESFVRSINQYLKATDLTFEVLDEFKLDIFKIKGLTNALLTKGGEERIVNRVQLANQQKNYQNAITMDSEDDYVQKQLSFGGIAETMDGIRKQVASDLRMPMTKLFGISSAGFNSGEDDIENYNAMVESEIRNKIKYHLLKLIRIRCLLKYGFEPDDLEIEFKSLRILSSEQEETVKTQKFQRALQAKQANEITTAEFRAMCNKDNLMPIKLDESEDIVSALGAAKPADTKTDNEGDQLSKGTDVEMEHADTIKALMGEDISEEAIRKTASSIAKDHIKEDPKYYDKLSRIHKE